MLIIFTEQSSIIATPEKMIPIIRVYDFCQVEVLDKLIRLSDPLLIKNRD